MFKIDNVNAATVIPTPQPPGVHVNGFFRKKNAELSQDATNVDADWLNAVQEELCNIVIAGGLSLDKTNRSQVLGAINALINTAFNSVSPSLLKTINQNGHGFEKGEILYFHPSGYYAKGRADSINTSWTVGMVYEVVSVSRFKIIQVGYITGLSGLTVGINYLSVTVYGGLQSTQPAGTSSAVIKPCFIADSATSGFFFNFSPALGGGGTPEGVLLAENNLDDLDDVAEARSNLGLGSAAESDVEDFIASSELASLATTDYVDDAITALNINNYALVSYVDDSISDLNIGNYALTTYVDGEIDTVNASIGGLTSTVGGILSDIGALQTDVSDLQTDLTNYATLVYVDEQVAIVAGDLSDFETSVASTYLTAVLAASTYLTIANATSTYLTISNAASTYLSITNAASTYLSLVNAASTYLTIANAASTYLTQANAASTYLTQSNAASTYLTQSNAASTYATQSALTSGLAGKQALNAILTSIAGLTVAADTLIYGSGSNAVSAGTITAAARTFTALADPNIDGIIFWDDSASSYAFLSLSGDLSLTNTTLSSKGRLPTVEVTGTSQSAAINTKYITNNASLVTVTLPATAAVGDEIEISGSGAGMWRVAQQTGQTMVSGSYTGTTSTGVLNATQRYDSCTFECITANTTWKVKNVNGIPDLT